MLADEPADGSDDQYFDDLMPISLSDATKGISASFNLQENATRWNNFVYIHGIRKQYMSAPGIKEVKNIWIGDPDEQPDPTVVPDDNGNDNPDDPDNPVIDDGDDSGALTIAEAIDALWDQKIWVKGYIVGTTRVNLANTKFDGILENFTAIVLADEPGTTQKDLLFPVGLETEDRQKLAQYGDNLINMKVKVLGMKGQKGYMGQAGFKTAGAVIIIE